MSKLSYVMYLWCRESQTTKGLTSLRMLEMTVRSIARSTFVKWTVNSFKVTSRGQHNYFIVLYTFDRSFFDQKVQSSYRKIGFQTKSTSANLFCMSNIIVFYNWLMYKCDNYPSEIYESLQNASKTRNWEQIGSRD